jgi:predicted enzyme related to lactoylglutathione lyase
VAHPHGHFVWYELITTDVDAAKAFYVEVMGWRARDLSMPGMAFTLFMVGRTPVSGLMNLPEGARKMGAQPRWVGYVGVDDLDAATDRIERLGGAVYGPPMVIPNTTRFLAFSDPQVAMLGVMQSIDPDHAKPAHINAAGRIGWHELTTADCDKAFAFYGELFGWQRADADINAAGAYQTFAVDGEAIGGMITKPRSVPSSFWLYYFNVADLDAAAKRVAALGGRILDGPLESPGGAWIVQCIDPQGALFALAGERRRTVGYFEGPASRDPADTRRRQWSW